MLKKILRKVIDMCYVKKGYTKGYGVDWFGSAIKELRQSKLPMKKKLWAIKNGFYPYRIAQYGLTKENYKECLSDRDYKRMYPINNSYKKWIDDKLIMKYILIPFDAYLPEYYFHVMSKRKSIVMKLQDCPEECTGDYDGILRLLMSKGELALKPVVGTYGIGFCKLGYHDDKFYINNKENSVEDMHRFFDALEDHIIIEYVKMHNEIHRLNPNSLNTIRVMLINENGNNPLIPSAFMRIGTKQSGLVDNTAQGGMFCKIDVETGRFYDGEKISNHIITPSPIHPDTEETVEGIIPHWDTVKLKLIEISNYIPQLEWLGFDIAITNDGFKIIEINSHQGLHRYHTYPQEVKDYFNRKLNEQK